MRTLFDEIRIGQINLRNRLVRSSTWEKKADASGRMTEELYGVYEKLADGHIGLILTGYAFVTPDEQPNPRMMGIFDDSFINEYRPLADMVHKKGGHIAMQIAYGGTRTTFQPAGRNIWGPSSVAEYTTGVVATKMTVNDIGTLVKDFGDAAFRAKSAGFDGVQIHAAHGYLLGQFLSPYHNRRADLYGGTIENRGRIILETFETVRARVGESFPVMIKINSGDLIPEGASFDDCRYVCRELSKLGIDAIEISGGIRAPGDPCSVNRVTCSEKDEGYFAEAAAAVADEIATPVILVGGLRSPKVMNRLLETTKMECFAMSRPFLAEPLLVKRWESGDLSRAKCRSCNKCRTPQGNQCPIF